MTLPTDAKARKDIPIYSGFIKYFPDAIAAVAELSRIGNDQHNPGKPLHWDRSKSGDELDALARHLTDEAKGVELDTDNVRHLTKCAWRAMAALQKALEGKREQTTWTVRTTQDHPDRRYQWLMQRPDGSLWAAKGRFTRAEIEAQRFLSTPIMPLE